MNQSANVTLALGASLVIACNHREQDDLSGVHGGLLIRIGAFDEESVHGMLAAGARGKMRTE